MTKESEVEKTARHRFIGIVLIIVIVAGAIYGIVEYWTWHQQEVPNQYVPNITNSFTPTSTPYTNPTRYPLILYYQPMSSTSNSEGPPYMVNLTCNNLAPSEITLSNSNFFYNGETNNTYGKYAPTFVDNYDRPISQITLPAQGSGQGLGDIMIIFPGGNGSPWVPGENVTIAIQTVIAQGSITVGLP